ncbi:hypothetical protein [Caulobacter segnis]
MAFKATTRRAQAAKHSVYIVMLHDPRRTDPWGLYVRQTARDPDLRFDQRKRDTRPTARPSASARRAPALTEHLNPMRQWESLDLEAALALAFRAAGVPWVEGGH